MDATTTAAVKPSQASETIGELNSFATAQPPELPDIDDKINLLDLLKGSTGELHAIHIRLEEMVPHLDGAIAKSDGLLKHILMSLSDILR